MFMIGRLNIANMVILLHVSYRFTEFQSKPPIVSFMEIEKLFFKYLWKWKGFRIARAILAIQIKLEDLYYQNLRLRGKTTVIKTMWHWNKHRETGSWNKTESPEKIYTYMVT